MCVCVCINMTSKNISITKAVYNKLIKIKAENESFSELFLRLLKVQKYNIEKSFGVWKLSEKEMEDIWGNINNRAERRWKKLDIGKIK